MARIGEVGASLLIGYYIVSMVPGIGPVLMVAGIVMGGIIVYQGYRLTQSREVALQQQSVKLAQEGLFSAAFASGLLVTVKTTGALASLKSLNGIRGIQFVPEGVAVLCLLDDPIHLQNVINAVATTIRY